MFDEYARHINLSTEYEGAAEEYFELHKEQIPSWYKAFRIVCLIQPSSCAERVFSILNLAMGDRQESMLADSTTTIVMLGYNR